MFLQKTWKLETWLSYLTKRLITLKAVLLCQKKKIEKPSYGIKPSNTEKASTPTEEGWDRMHILHWRATCFHICVVRCFLLFYLVSNNKYWGYFFGELNKIKTLIGIFLHFILTKYGNLGIIFIVHRPHLLVWTWLKEYKHSLFTLVSILMNRKNKRKDFLWWKQNTHSARVRFPSCYAFRLSFAQSLHALRTMGQATATSSNPIICSLRCIGQIISLTQMLITFWWLRTVIT